MNELKVNNDSIQTDNNLGTNDLSENPIVENQQSNTPKINLGVEPSGIEPSGGNNGYVLGQLGYDFGTETNKALWEQRLNGQATDPKVMVAFLRANPHDATELIWTISQDTVPIYAVHPTGPYAPAVYERIIQLYSEQLDGVIERVAVAGIVHGFSRLLDGHVVNNILVSNPRYIVGWNTADLTKAALGSKASAAVKSNFENFLQRIYHEMRNHGISDGNRALNYAATNAYQPGSVFTQAFKDGMQLASVTTSPSPIARPGTITYDINMTFFNPNDQHNTAKKVYRFMVDVSEVMPVSVGQIRSWSVY